MAVHCQRAARLHPVGVRAGHDEEPQRRSSSFSSPTAFSSWSERRELEHTSSPKDGLWWAGVIFGVSSPEASRGSPRRASCQAASLPARPAPITITGSMGPSYLLSFGSQPYDPASHLGLLRRDRGAFPPPALWATSPTRGEAFS